MMQFHNLNISSQLKAGFGIIISLILFLSIVAWEMNNQLARQTTDLYDHPHTVRKAVGDLRADVLLIQRSMKDLALVESEDHRSLILQNLDLYKADVEKQFRILYDRYLGPLTDIDSASVNFSKWNTTREVTIAYLREGNFKEVVNRSRLGGAGAQQAEKMLENVARIDKFSSEKSKEFYQRAVRLNSHLKRELLVAVAVVLAITLLIVNILSRNIRTPLKSLTEATNNFKKGMRKARSSYGSRNEFGILSNAYNEMADTIETELNLNEQSANLTSIMLGEDEAHLFTTGLLSSLLEYTGGQMGAVYFLNEEKTRFECFESIGMTSGESYSFSSTDHEGEIGTAVAEGKIQYITDIPEQTVAMYSTVIGKFKPSEIITIPLLIKNETKAVISLASITPFNKNSIPLLQTIHSTLSARMDGILTYRKVVDFSQKLEQQNQELESQKNELYLQAHELNQQNIELELQKKQVDDSNKLKTAFLSSMSHELRTPLNSVIALSGVLNRRLKEKIPVEEYSYLEIIERNGKQLLDLINDILDLSRIESGREEVNLRKFNINSLVREIMEVVESQTAHKNVSLILRSSDDLPEITSDYEKCRHILQNIIANAFKFTEKGEVRIESEIKEERILIHISDTGIGIDKEFLPVIFEEFRQADSSNSRKYGGTGLGLSIANKYAQLLGGTIKVRSTKGKGSKFTVSLPLKFDETTPQEETRDSVYVNAHPAIQSSSKAKTVLLVEDMDAVIIQLKDFLESQDYQTIVAHDGMVALEKIDQKIPDVMILDLMMPGMDGFEVLRQIRAGEKTSGIPVIILTAKYITKEENSLLKQYGVDQIFQKGNINKQQLLNAVDRIFPNRGGYLIAEKGQSFAEKNRSTRKPVVLIIEDNADNLITIKALLPENCEVLAAEDGMKGIRMLKRFKPDLILLDITLPGLSGIDVLKEIRNGNNSGGIPVIAVTANAMEGDKEELLANGFDSYISKPINNDLFQQVISGFIQQA